MEAYAMYKSSSFTVCDGSSISSSLALYAIESIKTMQQQQQRTVVACHRLTVTVTEGGIYAQHPSRLLLPLAVGDRQESACYLSDLCRLVARECSLAASTDLISCCPTSWSRDDCFLRSCNAKGLGFCKNFTVRGKAAQATAMS